MELSAGDYLRRLLKSLPRRTFVLDADPVLAFRIAYDGTSLSWRVSGGVLTTTVAGGSGGNLSLPLAGHTLSWVADWIDAQPGYSLPYRSEDSELMSRDARALIEESGNRDAPNGDHLRAHGSLLWSLLGTFAEELRAARAAIVEMVKQVGLSTASGGWLDEHGVYWSVRRRAGELDESYVGRIIAETLRPKGNNVSIAEAIEEAYPDVSARVYDFHTTTQQVIRRDSNFFYDGLYLRDGSPALVAWGLFDVEIGVEFVSGAAPSDYLPKIIATVEALRDAGTQLRQVRFKNIATEYYPWADVAETFEPVADYSPVEPWGPLHDGTYARDGSIPYSQGLASEDFLIVIA